MADVLQTDAALADRRLGRDASGRIATAGTAAPDADSAALSQSLARAIEGEVRFDGKSLALYSTDGSNYRQVPVGVVIPKTLDDVIAAVSICRAEGVPILSRGGGTSLAGQTCNTAVVIDFSKYLTRVLELDPERRLARVEPGCILDTLRDAAEQHGLTFGPDPATHDHNTLGGMLGNNSCGVHSIMAGRTSDNVQALDILTYDGLRLTVGPTSDEEFQAILRAGGRRAEIYRRLDTLRRRYGELIRARFPKIPRRVSGYENLDQLLPENGFNVARALVGTEGTCVLVLEALLDLVPSPPARVLVLIGFPDVFEAADAVPRVLEFGPIACEGIDSEFVHYVKVNHIHEEYLQDFPEGCGWLIVEFGGASEDEAAEKADKLVQAYRGGKARPKLVRDKTQQHHIWKIREAALGATAYAPGRPPAYPGLEDTAVHRDNFGRYLRDFRALLKRYDYDAAFYGHFGEGLVHCRIDFDFRSEAGVSHWRRFMEDAADLVVRYGGSISGEHGDGQARAALLERMYGPELMQAFREFKSIWDPDGRMNPGKVVDPYPITSNLRFGPEYRPPQLDTHFAYARDGSFVQAAERCVGFGKCRRPDSRDGQVMCPSYMATRAEQYSTRGRSRLLFEMLHGGPLQDGWRSEAVEEALDLCLACKGCKNDCPVNVDMATLKAEFRSHHYAGRLRPRAAYSMGLIYWWSRAAAVVPSLANALTQTPGLSALVKWAGGIAQERRMPPYAPESFRSWFARRRPPQSDGPRVLLWPDCFNGYFKTGTAIAATHVLEAAGWNVSIPRRPLCCGRPLYDWGMLDTAKALWRQTLDTLREDIEAGVPLVGLEPACVTSFRDELVALFPEDPLAKKLSGQSLIFSEFIERHCQDLELPKLEAKALVQVHCHHHAVIKPKDEWKLLDRLGVDYTHVPSGCCGLAGSFGFEADKYEVSMTAAERVLLPAVREASPDTLILADGFSCREQIEQGTGRETLHVAELVADALGLRPVVERERCASSAAPSATTLLLAAGVGLALGVAVGRAARRGS